jgi:hypothetical protein
MSIKKIAQLGGDSEGKISQRQFAEGVAAAGIKLKLKDGFST